VHLERMTWQTVTEIHGTRRLHIGPRLAKSSRKHWPLSSLVSRILPLQGLWPNYLKVVPSIAIAFVTYEQMKEWMGVEFRIAE
jgi:hypothetical protein